MAGDVSSSAEKVASQLACLVLVAHTTHELALAGAEFDQLWRLLFEGDEVLRWT